MIWKGDTKKIEKCVRGGLFHQRSTFFGENIYKNGRHVQNRGCSDCGLAVQCPSECLEISSRDEEGVIDSREKVPLHGTQQLLAQSTHFLH